MVNSAPTQQTQPDFTPAQIQEMREKSKAIREQVLNVQRHVQNKVGLSDQPRRRLGSLLD